MILRATSQIGILLFVSAALAACQWGDNTATEPVDLSGDVAPVHGTAVFKSVEPALRKGTATFEGRDVVVYWDDQTIFVRGGKAVRAASKYWVAESPAGRAPVGAAPTGSARPPSGQYYKETKVVADIEPPQPGEAFEFRGFKSSGQIALRVVSFQ